MVGLTSTVATVAGIAKILRLFYSQSIVAVGLLLPFGPRG